MRNLVCLSLLAAAPVAFAAARYPKAIKDAMAHGVKVVTKFPAASGLTGWVLNRDGTYSMAFTTADGKTLIMGTLINEKGENLTDQYADKYFPKPDRSALYKQLEQSAYVIEGTTASPKSILYVVLDTNNPYCRSLWKALRPYQRVGLQVRWVLVATRGSSSMQEAIEILGAPDKAQALRKILENTNGNSRTASGLSEADKTALTEKVKNNSAVLEKFGLVDAPVIVWKDRAGKAQLKASMPRLSDLPAITRLPVQEVDVPEMERGKR